MSSLKKLHKKSISLLLVFLMSFTLLTPYTTTVAYGNEEVITQKEAIYLELTEDTSFYNAEKQSMGKLLKGAILQSHNNENSIYYFIINNEEFHIDSANVNQLNEDFIPTNETQSEETLTEAEMGTIVNNDTPVYLDESRDTIIAFLNANLIIPIIENKDDLIKISLNNQDVFVDNKDIKVAETIQVEDEADDSSSITEEIVTEDKEESSVSEEIVTEDKQEISLDEEVAAPEVKKLETVTTTRSFRTTDKYFEVVEDLVAVYHSDGGKLTHVGYLNKGQVFPRVSDYGDWHQIKYGGGTGFVWKAATKPVDNPSIKNLNNGLVNSTRRFQAIDTLTVYDNSSGILVPFARIFKGVSYPVISEMGDWLQIDISGRIGYVYKPATKLLFTSADSYFQAKEARVSVYDNSSGSLVHVGYLLKDQVYPRVRDYGDWHQIKYGNGLGYVWKDATQPVSNPKLGNLNSTNLKNSSEMFTAIDTLTVYDNSSGKLVPFAEIFRGVKYPLIRDLGDWIQIDIVGRIGYVYKPATKFNFKSTDQYFETITDNVAVYENRGGTLIHVGNLQKGQVYPRLRDYGDWHQIKYGRGTAFVWKDATKPVSGSSIKNLSGIASFNDTNFQGLSDLTVYDNTSGSLVPFGTLKKGEVYPFIRIVGDWVMIDFSGRIGYVYKGNLQIGPIYNYTNYTKTLQEMVNIQMTVSPQTDKKYQTFVRQDALSVNNTSNPTSGLVTTSGWRVRIGPDQNTWSIGTLNPGETVSILSKAWNATDNMWWYEIRYNRTWVNASPDDVKNYLNPSNFSTGTKEYFQFLLLSGSAGTNVNELNNKVLVNKGILTGKGQAFLEGATLNNINEVYLISHALLETGNGSSTLANGILVSQVDGQSVEPKVVYNMYGINAKDSCPDTCGAEYAYKQGWFTPELAIIGGAKFISSGYINNGSYKQDTLYKMRWNPAAPGTHQYATDIGWSYKQVNNISKIYDLLDSYILTYDIPVYK